MKVSLKAWFVICTVTMWGGANQRSSGALTDAQCLERALEVKRRFATMMGVTRSLTPQMNQRLQQVQQSFWRSLRGQQARFRQTEPLFRQYDALAHQSTSYGSQRRQEEALMHRLQRQMVQRWSHMIQNFTRSYFRSQSQIHCAEVLGNRPEAVWECRNSHSTIGLRLGIPVSGRFVDASVSVTQIDSSTPDPLSVYVDIGTSVTSVGLQRNPSAPPFSTLPLVQPVPGTPLAGILPGRYSVDLQGIESSPLRMALFNSPLVRDCALSVAADGTISVLASSTAPATVPSETPSGATAAPAAP